MIRALRIEQDLASKREFEALSHFLELLGLQNETGRSKKQERCATFSAPFGKVRFSWKKVGPDERRADRWSFAIEVDDPDTLRELIRRKGYEIISDLSEDQTGKRHLVVRVTPSLQVAVFGAADEWMKEKETALLHANAHRFGIIVSRFNSFITERLLQGARDALLRLGSKKEHIDIVHVPGSFEIPSVARTLAETKRYDAIICIGCLLRGDTAHYDVIANEVTRGIGQSAQETGVPHAFAVLTCDTLEQAIDRAGLKSGNKGFEAALAAVEMASLKKAVSRQPSATTENQKSRQSARSKKSQTQR